MLYWISKWWFKLSGWRVEGSFEPVPPKFIAIIGPHTSNFDFIIGVFARSYLGLQATKYLGKKELFRFPYGFIFRALGGYPVDRSRHNNLVDAVVDIFNRHERFSIALAPEGTRSKVDRLKTGFYHIARKAGIPIYPVGFDYATKRIVIAPPLLPTDNIREDFRLLLSFYENIKGKYPEKGIDMNMLEKTIKGQE